MSLTNRIRALEALATAETVRRGMTARDVMPALMTFGTADQRERLHSLLVTLAYDCRGDACLLSAAEREELETLASLAVCEVQP